MGTTPLAHTPVLVLDCQATGASPQHGHLLEIGWLSTRADRPVDPEAVSCSLVALPQDATIPSVVRELTGIRKDDLADAPTAAEVWARVRDELAAIAGGDAIVPAVIHFARFEHSFLQPLHERLAPGVPFPLQSVCTHEIARRLLPGIPRRGLRALAGYFGHATDELRRSRGHVWATALVWRHVVDELAKVGVTTFAELSAWLAAPAPKPGKRVYPMPREVRLGLPDGPGVYRMLRTSGDVLYVGKATSLKRRVNQYFQKQSKIPDRMLEMLSQARDLDVTPTASALEAALLETDEIKRHAPPFNQALVHGQRSTWFVDATLALLSKVPTRRHRLGPLGSGWHARRFVALQSLLAGGLDEEHERRAIFTALGRPAVTELDAAVWNDGFSRFVESLPSRAIDRRAAMQIGASLWRAEIERGQPLPEPDGDGNPIEDAPWDADDVHEHLAEVLLTIAHALRRARWLCALADASVAFVDGEARRRLVLERGTIVEAADHDPARGSAPSPGADRRACERRRAFDVATFDRLRVLTTELRRCADAGGAVAVRLDRRRWIAGERLRRVLAWV